MNVNNSLRVLQVGKFYPPHMGGIETHLQALCGELRRSVSVRVIVANDEKFYCEEAVDGVRVTRLGQLFSLSSAPVCPQMARAIREAKADIVHIHLPNPAALVAYMISGHRGPLILTWHSDIVRQKVLARMFNPIQQHLMRRSAALIVTSPNYLDSSSSLKNHRERCRVIPYGIASEQFIRRDDAAVAALRERYGPRIVLGVGRLIYYKGFEYLMRAMTRVRGNLVLVGDGPLRRRIEREASALGVRDRIFFVGEIQNHQIAPYYHAADVFVLPSIARSEAFGIVQLEAMACGKPVVNTSLKSGVPFVSPDGLTGITVPPCEVEPLASAINRLLDDPELCASYGAAAASRVQEHFSVKRMAERTLDLYREVTGTISIADDALSLQSA